MFWGSFCFFEYGEHEFKGPNERSISIPYCQSMWMSVGMCVCMYVCMYVRILEAIYLGTNLMLSCDPMMS